MVKKAIGVMLFVSLFFSVGACFAQTGKGNVVIEERAQPIEAGEITEGEAVIEEIETPDVKEVVADKVKEAVEEKAEEAVAPGSVWEELGKMDTQIGIMAGQLDGFLGVRKNKALTKAQIRTQFNNFEQELSNTDAQVQVLYAAIGSICSKSKRYFGQWQEELEAIKSSSLRKRGEKKKEKESKLFTNFDGEAAKTEQALGEFVSGLEDILHYLRFDLTVKNINSISKELKNVKKSASAAKKQIQRMNKNLEKLSSSSDIIEFKQN